MMGWEWLGDMHTDEWDGYAIRCGTEHAMLACLLVGMSCEKLLLCIRIYIIYTPNLGLKIAVLRRKGSRAALKGAPREQRGSREGVERE